MDLATDRFIYGRPHGFRSRAARAMLTLAGGAAAALAAVIGLAALASPAMSEAAFTASTVGRLSLTSPEAARATLDAGNLAPGQALRGILTIRNEGASQAPLALSRCRVRDVPGPNGGVLSTRLQVKLAEISRPRDRAVYGGRLRRFGRVLLGSLAPNETRRYAVTVAFAEGGHRASQPSADNAFQGASATIDFCWTKGG